MISRPGGKIPLDSVKVNKNNVDAVSDCGIWNDRDMERREVGVPETLTAILYRSESLLAADGREERDLLAHSASRNTQRRVSGFLHREADHYYQWLEGPRVHLEALFELILVDPRHRAIEVLRHGPIAERQFSRWSMGQSDRNCTLLFDWAAHNHAPMRSMSAEHFLAFLRDCSLSALRRDTDGDAFLDQDPAG